MAASAGVATVEIRPDFGSFKKDLSSGLTRAGGGIQSFGKTMTRNVTLPLVGIGAAAGTVGLKTAASLEQSEIAFKTFYGSTENAQAVMEDLANFAATTPFDLPGITDASKKLAAVGVASEDLIPIMTGVGDAVAGVGGGSQQIDQVAFAMQQVIGAGRAMTQDINQIASTGIPIWGELAAQMGVSEAEIRDLASQGKITDEVLQQAFTNPVGPLTTFSGLMEEQSGTLAGQWSTLVDTINIELADAFKDALPAIKDGLSQLSEAIGPALQAAGPAFAALITAAVPLIDFVAELLVAFSELSPEMQKWIVYAIAGTAAMGPMLNIFGRFVRVLSPVVRGIGGLAKAGAGIGKFVGTIFKMSRAFGILKTFAILFNILKLTIVTGLRTIGLAFLTNPIGLLITAIVAIIAGAVFLIVKYWDEIKAAFAVALEFIKRVAQGIWDFLVAAFNAVIGALQAVGSFIVEVFTAIWGFLQPILELIFNIITLPFKIWWILVRTILGLALALFLTIFNAIVNFVRPIWEALWEGVKKVVTTVWDFIKSVFTKIWDFIKEIFNRVKGFVTSVWSAIYNAVKDKVSSVYNAVKDKIQAAKDFVVNAFNTLKDKVSGVWDNIKGIVSGAVDAIKGFAEGMWGGLKSAINSGIGILNGAITRVNGLINKVNSFPLNPITIPTIPTIPYLAEGGIVQRGTLAVVGEAGPEAVIPLSKLDAFMDVKDKEQPIYLQVKIGERDITDMIERVNRSERESLARTLVAGRRL